MPVRALALYCLSPLAAVAVAFLARQLTLFARGEQKLALFLTPLAILVWLVLAVVPVFPIWHIYPNLAGASLFFLSSSGLCVALAMLALPSVEPVGKGLFSVFSVPALIALAALYLVWFYALQVNLGAWQQASTLVESFAGQLRQTVLNSGQKHLVILNLPQDYNGAFMLGRKSYLDILNRPPIIGVDISPRLTVIEPETTGNRDFIWPQELAGLLKRIGPANFYIWSNDGSTLKHFETLLEMSDKERGHPDLAQVFARGLGQLPTLQAGRWQAVNKDTPVVRKSGGNWDEIAMPENGGQSKDTEATNVTIWLPVAINPRRADNWMLSLDVEDEHGVGMASKCQAVWRNCVTKEIVGGANPYIDRHHGQYLFYLGRYRSFLLSNNALELGLRFRLGEGPVRFKASTLALSSDQGMVPGLTMDLKNGRLNWDAAALIKNDPARSFDELRFFVTKSDTTVDPSTELDLYQPSLLEKSTPLLRLPLTATEGAGSLPASRLITRGTSSRQVVVVAASKDGKTISLPSPPMAIER
jgi:hypothetical protein